MGRHGTMELPAADATSKRDRLTLTQLAGYDDLLTDALVDHVYFWTTIRKNRSKYNQTRGISEDDVTNILLHDVVVAKDSLKAEGRLLLLPGIRKYFNHLHTEREKDDFKRHMRKYINMWLPDSPFEISTTNRYTITTHEAATTARRTIRAGETIKYLCGNLVAMTPGEEKDMDLTRRDFSVVLSSRKKTPSLFLGPARFSNHDCNANARLVTRGSEGMVIVAARNIEIGEEITVNYGTDYFGEDNCECLCFSCEQASRGGWSLRDGSDDESTHGTPNESPGQEATILRSRQGKRSHESGIDSRAGDALLTNSSKKKRQRLDHASPGDRSSRMRLPRSLLKTGTKAFPALYNLVQLKQDPTAALSKGESADLVTAKAGELRSKLQVAKGGFRKVASAASSACLSTSGLKPRGLIFEQQKVALQPPSREAQMFLSLFSKARAQKLEKVQKIGFLRARVVHAPAKARSQGSRTSNSSSSAGSIFEGRHPPESSPDTSPSASESVHSSHGNTSTQHTSLSPEPSESPLTSLSSEISAVPPNMNAEDHRFKRTGELLTNKRGRSQRSIHAGSTTEHSVSQNRASSATCKNSLLKHTLLNRRQSNTSPRKSAVFQSIEEATSSCSEDADVSDDELHIVRTPGDYKRTRLLLAVTTSRWVDCRTCENVWVQDNAYSTRKECPRCERHSKLYGYQWPKTENSKGEFEERVMDHRTVHRFLPREEEAQEKKRGRGVEAVVEASSRAESLEDDAGGSAARGSRKTRGSRLVAP